MASIVVSGDTSGAVTLSAPSVAGTTTVTLPSSTGTMALLQTPSFATTIGVGGATASASGSGISFPATQSASSDANTLDDYEEGNWTPAMSFGNGTTGITYSTQSGFYIKVGSQVTIWAQIVLSNRGSSTGTGKITGLPFTNANSSGRTEGASVVFNYWGNLSGTPIPTGYVQNNATTIALDNGIGSNSVASLTEANFTNSSNIYFNGTYSVV